MTKGTVKWFNTAKGYGFISPDDGSKDAFVHISAMERAGLTSLSEGQQVEFELRRVGEGAGKPAVGGLSLFRQETAGSGRPAPIAAITVAATGMRNFPHRDAV